MIGWCEDCGDVEVYLMCHDSGDSFDPQFSLPIWWWSEALPECCHYADCPLCGEDVDQWATS